VVIARWLKSHEFTSSSFARFVSTSEVNTYVINSSLLETTLSCSFRAFNPEFKLGHVLHRPNAGDLRRTLLLVLCPPNPIQSRFIFRYGPPFNHLRSREQVTLQSPGTQERLGQFRVNASLYVTGVAWCLEDPTSTFLPGSPMIEGRGQCISPCSSSSSSALRYACKTRLNLPTGRHIVPEVHYVEYRGRSKANFQVSSSDFAMRCQQHSFSLHSTTFAQGSEHGRHHRRH